MRLLSEYLTKRGIAHILTREPGGGDWEANVEQLKAENAKLAEAGGARITNLPSSGADDGEGGDGEGEGKGENA